MIFDVLRIGDPRVKAAFEAVDRAEFLEPDQRPFAGHDRPLDIGFGQTTSQPSLVAWTVDQLHLGPASRVLEVGTGCGYQTALLSRVAKEVYSVDLVAPLVERARAALARLGYANVHLDCRDGYLGWPEAAPFDGIVVSAGARVVPQPLVDQLAVGGRMLIPVGTDDDMDLLLVTRTAEGVRSVPVLPVRFVPLRGELAERDRGRSSRS